MANKFELGYSQADSRNLPKVSLVTVWKFFHNNDKFNAPEARIQKLQVSKKNKYKCFISQVS